MRSLGILLASVPLLVLSGCAAAPGSVTVPSAPSSARASAPSGDPPAVEERALRALHAWVDARSDAWARADPRGLRAVYADGSLAGERDAALLRRYAGRGIAVPELRMQVLRAAVLVDRPRRVVLRVVWRLADRAVHARGAALRLPRDRAVVRVIELRRADSGQESGWQLVSLRRPGSAGRTPG